MNDEAPREILQNLAATYYNLSQVSAQEAAYNILQLKMCEAGRMTAFIATDPPEYRRHMLKSKDELMKMDDDVEDVDCAARFEENREIILSNRNEFSAIVDETIKEFLAEAEQGATTENEDNEEEISVDEDQNNLEVNRFIASSRQLQPISNESGNIHIEDAYSQYFRFHIDPEDN
ncbi:hypothetical protein EDC96DRAFT_586987 [Choanephora cucurbitarum]|nr:hypothetical protein EDC96DRAFT_586987 [Choanephora cucurbitarum]